ncbi:MAG: hypothetical protein H0X29_03025 [Parachlamydiaceae bacterium]|nr:hypothetical protein [Parachlamydiaceae bacterium]
MLNMNVLIYYMMWISVGIIGINLSCNAKEDNLLKDGFAAVAITTDDVEGLYVQAIEKDYELYVQLGADWDTDGKDGETKFAGLQVLEQPTILFIKDDSFDHMNEIAFENVRPNTRVKLSKSDIAEINEALIISHIKSRSVNPKEFNIDLD